MIIFAELIKWLFFEIDQSVIVAECWVVAYFIADWESIICYNYFFLIVPGEKLNQS